MALRIQNKTQILLMLRLHSEFWLPDSEFQNLSLRFEHYFKALILMIFKKVVGLQSILEIKVVGA
jgi:hypothetical protein